MKAEVFFPETLAFDIGEGEVSCKKLNIVPSKCKEHLIYQGKALEMQLGNHLNTLTPVIFSKETADEQWFDLNVPGLFMLDAKSRSPGTHTFTISAREQRLQYEYSCADLFIWPCYRVDGKLFVREGVLARLRGTELIPPALNHSTKIKNGSEAGWYWWAEEVQIHGTKALAIIDSLGLLDPKD